MPTLSVLKIIAKSDPSLFEHHLNQAGLTIVGYKDTDPLRKSMQDESIFSIASSLAEDIDDTIIMTKKQRELRNLAEQHGYLVGLIEGMDQSPGTWPNPIKAMLNAGPEDEEAPAGGDQTQDGAPPPPDGGGPPPPGGEAPPPM